MFRLDANSAARCGIPSLEKDRHQLSSSSRDDQIIKLIRNFLEVVAPDVVILTETNVPHEENISYFGKGDEAHAVYQFSLPPLLLHGLLRGTSAHLTEWAANLHRLPRAVIF